MCVCLVLVVVVVVLARHVRVRVRVRMSGLTTAGRQQSRAHLSFGPLGGGRRTRRRVRSAATAVAAPAAALAQHLAGPTRHSLVDTAPVAGPGLPLVTAPRLAPLARADVSGVYTLLVDFACSLGADRETLARAEEALLAAAPLHHCAGMTEGGKFAPARPRNAPPGAPAPTAALCAPAARAPPRAAAASAALPSTP